MDNAVDPSNFEPKEHNRHIRLAQPDKSAVAEHNIKQDDIIKLSALISFQLKPDTWIDSSGKSLNLKCTHKTSREKTASP